MQPIDDLVPYIVPTNTSRLQLMGVLLGQLKPGNTITLPKLLTDVVENAWEFGSKHHVSQVNSLLRKHGIEPVAVPVPAGKCRTCSGTGRISEICFNCAGTKVDMGKPCRICGATGSTEDDCYECVKGVVPARTNWSFSSQVRKIAIQGW